MNKQYIIHGFVAAMLTLRGCCVSLQAQSNKTTQASSSEGATCSSLGEMLVELKKLRLELLGFYAVAKQEKTSELELKISELEAQRERLDTEERRAVQHLSELNAQLASASAEERERIEAEKASRGGPALEQLRTRQASLGRQEGELRGLLASEQDRLTQLKRLIAESDAPARR